MATYKTIEEENKELKVQIRRFTELLEYYRGIAGFDMDVSLPPPNYFVSPMDNWTAGYISNGRPVLIESNLLKDVIAIERCWVHLRSIDPFVKQRAPAAKKK